MILHDYVGFCNQTMTVTEFHEFESTNGQISSSCDLPVNERLWYLDFLVDTGENGPCKVAPLL